MTTKNSPGSTYPQILPIPTHKTYLERISTSKACQIRKIFRMYWLGNTSNIKIQSVLQVKCKREGCDHKVRQIKQPAFLFQGHVWQPKSNIYSEEEISIYAFNIITFCLELTMVNLHSQLFTTSKFKTASILNAEMIVLPTSL